MEKGKNLKILQTPLNLPDLQEKQTKRNVKQWASSYDKEEKKQLKEKEDALFAYFEVNKQEKNAWEILARKMAKKFFSGFSAPIHKKGRGRETIWNDYLLALYWFDIQTADCSPQEATQKILETDFWNKILTNNGKKSPPSEDSLRRMFYKAEKSLHIDRFNNLCRVERLSKTQKDKKFAQSHEFFANIVSDQQGIWHPKAKYLQQKVIGSNAVND